MNNDTKLILEEIKKSEERLQGEMRELEGRLRSEIKEQGEELRSEMREQEERLRSEIKEQGEELRSEIKEQGEELRSEMKEQEKTLRQEIRDGDNAIRLILENDIIPKINILAENHLDLNRKLDEMRADMKKNELLPFRVSMLESDVRKIKKQLAMEA